MPARKRIRRYEELLGAQLRRAVEIDRVRGLIGGKRDHVLHFLVDATLITFSAPKMLVLIASIGLYSAAGTCFIAAAWITTSMPSNAR